MSENRCYYLTPDHHLELRVEDVPSPGTGEVLIKIAANGICGSDLHFYKSGRLGNFVVTNPYIPGHEASGVIEALGRGRRQIQRRGSSGNRTRNSLRKMSLL